ncbi:SBBP repeat-containing protein [Desulfonatronum sp. SC1]|uniref:DUF7948 domain-containing protein n=1 Tax=Desulfonatronum sp. SC1 TaxID=2109626 RepID=UPI000D318270|nr:SBBP repeat-containing protein [Desulfonatronum sp. SC1]PTN33781.1 hypothetical protein C6366_13915 [Desulfonatronum sp. SC1]
MPRHTFSLTVRNVILVLVAVAAATCLTVPAMSKTSAGTIRGDGAYGKMPILFIPNQGQMDEQVAFSIQGRDKSIFFTSQGVTFALSVPVQDGASRKESFLRDIEPDAATVGGPVKRWVVKLDFVDARQDVLPETLEASETVISYFRGKPEEWHTGIQASSKIIYRDLWPGIDLIYYGTVNRLKYDFIVHPGADPGRIKLAYRGVDSLEVTDEGRLMVTTPAGAFYDDIPVAWQDLEEGRQDVAVAYAMEQPPHVQVAALGPVAGDAGSALGLAGTAQTHGYGFTVGAYDTTKPLVLDPEMVIYSGFIGGSADEAGFGIAVDSVGRAYVTGRTNSGPGSFPVRNGPYLDYNLNVDAFVARVRANGTGLEYCGYIGGSGIDVGIGIAVDGAGNAYVTGSTQSNDFPTAGNWPYTTYSGQGDAFIAKVKADGTGLIYSGYIGGGVSDYGRAVAVNVFRQAYVTGVTYSSNFPTKNGPNLTHSGGADAFVLKINHEGSDLVYSGFIGGTGDDHGYGIAHDVDRAYVVGRTSSSHTTFPVVAGPGLTYKGNMDAFVARVAPNGQSLEYCGYLGGSQWDFGEAIAVDLVTGAAYVTGGTQSSENQGFPVKVGPNLTHKGITDAFVAKINADASLAYAGYIGGASDDRGFGIAVDGSGHAYVAGSTASTEASFPVLHGPYLHHSGNYDAFVAKVRSDGRGLIYSGYIGGSSLDEGKAIAVDSEGSAYVTGETFSDELSFPTKTGPVLVANAGFTVDNKSDAFVTKIATGNLQVNIAPPAARTAGAGWRRAGTPDNWRAHGTAENGLAAGDYVVEFSTIPGWNIKSNETCQVQTGLTTTCTVTYVQNTSLYQILVSVAGQGGTVSGGGTYAHNALVTLTATPSQGLAFGHWAENSQKVDGASATYSFYATANRSLQAHFRKNSQAGVLLLLLDE